MFSYVKSINSLIKIVNIEDNKILVMTVHYVHLILNIIFENKYQHGEWTSSVFSENASLGANWNSFKYLQKLYYAKDNQMLI